MTVLAERSLVLNRSWIPIATVTVKKALTLLYSTSARVVHPETYDVYDFASWSSLRATDDERCVRTVMLRIRVPEVILLSLYNKIPVKSVVFNRRNLYRRDRLSCQYCGKRPGTEELTIDHIVPRSQGGLSSWTNCVAACVECNGRKAARSLHQAGLTLRSTPVKPNWSPMIEIPVMSRRASWEKFVSERYWNIELEE